MEAPFGPEPGPILSSRLVAPKQADAGQDEPSSEGHTEGNRLADVQPPGDHPYGEDHRTKRNEHHSSYQEDTTMLRHDDAPSGS